MTTRTLIHEDEYTRTYEVSDDKGQVIGTDQESKAPWSWPGAQPTVEDRISHLEESIKSAASLADLKAKVADGHSAETTPIKGK